MTQQAINSEPMNRINGLDMESLVGTVEAVAAGETGFVGSSLMMALRDLGDYELRFSTEIHEEMRHSVRTRDRATYQ